MWKREDLMKLSEQERIAKIKTMIHINDLSREQILKLKQYGLDQYIGYVDGLADVWLYPEEMSLLQ